MDATVVCIDQIKNPVQVELRGFYAARGRVGWLDSTTGCDAYLSEWYESLGEQADRVGGHGQVS
jgi:hypothetical protein